MWDRSKLFLRRAGTVILGINILLWFLVSYPKNADIQAKYDKQLSELSQSPIPPGPAGNIPEGLMGIRQAAVQKEMEGALLRESFAGKIGQFVEPALRPLGFDWKVGIGIVASFAAREVFVSTMSLVYNLGELDAKDAEAQNSLAETLKTERDDRNELVFTPLKGVTLMVFYVFALQCVSTIAIVRRETNSWKWPLFQLVYMTALAWILAFITYQGGRLLGFS
jgi:ferrous iron transport protein B